MARMPSRLCRCAADRGPSRVGNAALDSRPHSCSKRLLRSMLRAKVQRQEASEGGREGRLGTAGRTAAVTTVGKAGMARGTC